MSAGVLSISVGRTATRASAASDPKSPKTYQQRDSNVPLSAPNAGSCPALATELQCCTTRRTMPGYSVHKQAGTGRYRDTCGQVRMHFFPPVVRAIASDGVRLNPGCVKKHRRFPGDTGLRLHDSRDKSRPMEKRRPGCSTLHVRGQCLRST